jgi:hypothetical protein
MWKHPADASLVVIRAFGGRGLVRRVAESNERGVFVEGSIVGFPWEDVFHYDPAVLTEDAQNVDWSKLRLWKA